MLFSSVYLFLRGSCHRAKSCYMVIGDDHHYCHTEIGRRALRRTFSWVALLEECASLMADHWRSQRHGCCSFVELTAVSVVSIAKSFFIVRRDGNGGSSWLI